jgi:hypothetical protein
MEHFSIIQDSKTERSWLRSEEDGEIKLVECPIKDYPYLRLLASLIRNSEDPVATMEYVKEQIENNENENETR